MTAGTTYQLWAKRDATAGVNITAWAVGGSHQATLSGAQSADTFSFKVRRFSLVGKVAFPVALVPGMQIYYVRVPLVGSPDLIWGARFRREGQPNEQDDFEGTITLECATPLSELKTVLERVVFNPTDHPTDLSRVVRLMQVANLPLWVVQTSLPSITYQLPPVGEPTTVYEAKSVEEILNELRTDPGYPGDVDYPVPARSWQIYWQFATAGTPSSGVKWKLQWYSHEDLGSVTIPDNCYYHITDDPLDTEPHDAVLLAGSTYSKDPSEIVRSVHVAGPKTEPIQPTWKNDTYVKRGHGQIRKSGGTNGTWDAGAISRQRIIGGDWEVTCQTQELFLQHETFQAPDTPILLRSRMNTLWQRLTTTNTLSVRGGLGAPRLKVGLAQDAIEGFAATCILRSQWSTNRPGQQLLVRVQDKDNYYKLQNVGGNYTLYRVVAGTPTSLGSLGITPADGDDVKIATVGNEFQCYVNDGPVALVVSSSNFNTATKHGLGVDCDFGGTSHEARFYDLEITDFWGDRAFGIGDETAVTHWIDLSYGFVFNLNGTVTLVANGSTTGVTDAFTYNDWWRVSTMLRLNMTTRAMERLVIWYKMAGDGAEWVELHQEVTTQFVDKNNPWFVQFAAKEKGATLNNISLQKMYANQFHAPSPPFSAVDGLWPANGLYQSDELDTFQKRQQYSDAFFSMYAEAKQVFDGTVKPIPTLEGVPWVMYPPYTVAIRSKQRGWVDHRGTGGTDDRKILYMKTARWIDTPLNPDNPIYQLTATSRDLEIDLAGPRHLLNPKNKAKPPDNRAFAQQDDVDDGVVFEFDDPTGDENFGKWLQVQIAPQGQDDWDDAQLPVQRFDAQAARVTVPSAILTPGKQYLMRYQTEDATGLGSGWSGAQSFTAPKQKPYDAPYGYWLTGGGDITALTAGYFAQEVTFPEAGRIMRYIIKSPDIDAGVVVKLDVHKISEVDRREIGVSAYASIAGTDLPELPGPVSAANYRDSAALTGWSRQVAAGDTIRVEVLDTPTPTAKTVSLYLEFERQGTGT